jgi:hypothetical protein
MNMTAIIRLLILFLLPFYSSGQVLNYVISDIDLNGDKLTILFYDHFKGQYEETQFTQLCIVTINRDTICKVDREIWVEKPELYQKADINLDNRIGIFLENDKIYFWLTGFQYGCCINKTTIFEWTGNSLKEIFNNELEVFEIETINGYRYISGFNSLSESWGDINGDFYFSTYKPRPYYQLVNNMLMDKEMTIERNQYFKIYDENVDIFSATLVNINLTNEKILVSRKFAELLELRDFGILSLVKLERDYLRKFDISKLRLMRNEIFAIHGYRFNSQDLRNYFGRKQWYEPTDLTSEQIFNQLTEIEKHNISLIAEIEKNGW